MIRAVVLLATGGLLGGGAVYLLAGAGGNGATAGAGASVLSNIADAMRGPRAPEPGPVSVSETLSVYRAVVTEADADALQAMLEAAAAEPWSPSRDVEIDALLARLSDLAPARAAAAARALSLNTAFLADTYVSWARHDPDAAVAALTAIESSFARRDVALALIESLGGDSAALDRVTAGLPASERALLGVDWIAIRAESEPYAAFRDAQALRGLDLQRRALERVASVWAGQDPRGALAQSDLLPEELGSPFRVVVINEWSRLDGPDFLSWLTQNSAPPQEAVVGMRLLAASYPDLVFGVVDSMTGDVARSMKLQAMQALAEADPDAAMARLSAMPSGSDRENMLMAVGMAMVRKDPDEALSWARSLESPSPPLMRQVVLGIVQSDPDRAIEFLENPPEGVDPQLIASYVGSMAAREPGESETLANRLVAIDMPQAKSALRNLVGNWMQQDPVRAVEWVFEHDSDVGATVIGPAADAMSRADPVAAANYVHQVPQEYRSVWITQVVPGYAAHDMNAAVAWLDQFQGEAVYANALRRLLTASAERNPRAAADLLRRSAPEAQAGAATQVASALARLDPREAARWAASLQEPRIQSEAVASAMSVWAQNDISAARSYALGLEPGEARDQALSAVVARLSQAGDYDEARDMLSLVTSANVLNRLELQLDGVDP